MEKVGFLNSSKTTFFIIPNLKTQTILGMSAYFCE